MSSVLLMGQDDVPPPNNFQTILRSIGMLQHRPVFTTSDITTRTFRLDIKSFTARTTAILDRLQGVELDKLAVEYRTVAAHYVRATEEKANLLLKAANNGLFFVLKKFWEQVHIPNPLPKMELSTLIPKKSMQKYSQTRYQFDIDYVNSLRNINTSVLTYVREIYKTGQFETLNINVKNSIAQVLGENQYLLDAICEHENI